MINRRTAENFLQDAQEILGEAEAGLSRRQYHRAIRLSQEAFELSAKACLRAIGVEYPKEHDVSDALLGNRRKFPRWMQDSLEDVTRRSAWLAERRGPPMYGDEVKGLPARRLFNAKDGKKAVKYAETSVRIAQRLLNDLFIIKVTD